MKSKAVAAGVRGNVELLEPLRACLSSLPDGAYGGVLHALGGHSIGEHVRHVLEFYDLFLQRRGEVICYDERKRSHAVENDRAVAIEGLDETVDQLWRMEDHADHAVSVRKKRGETEHLCTSSTSRELFHLLDHTVHHMAIIRMGLQEAAPTVVVPDVFGVAASTTHYRKKTGHHSKVLK